jgi:hypothetical protein
MINDTPGTGDSKLATALPWQRVRQLIRFGVGYKPVLAVVMAARRMSQLPKKGVVCFYHPFRPLL